MMETKRWPFPMALEGKCPEKVAFLELAYERGHKPYREGSNNYGAQSNSREGFIIERGRTRWEIRLFHQDVRKLLAYLDSFQVASNAVVRWLDDASTYTILEAISDNLIELPGAGASFSLEEKRC